MKLANWEVGERVASTEPLGDVAWRYLQQLPDTLSYPANLQKFVVQAIRWGTPAFRQNWNSPLSASIPVQAEQDVEYIRPALEQFGAQRNPPPHKLLLLLNYPERGRIHRVEQAIQNVQMFQKKRPDVPVSYAVTEIPEATVIGGLRKICHDIDVVLSLSSEARDHLMINHDIDIVRLHPLYLRRMWNAFTQSPGNTTVVHSTVRHARQRNSKGELLFPNMDAVTAWHDFVADVQGSYYDLGNGISMRGYVAAGGYNPSLQYAETFELINKMNGKIIDHPSTRFAPGANLYTSPRRPYYKQYMQYDANRWWDQREDFVDVGYRQWNYTDIPDISPQWRDEQIREIVDPGRLAMRAALHARRMRPGLSPRDALVAGRRRLQVAHAMIGGPRDLLLTAA